MWRLFRRQDDDCKHFWGPIEDGYQYCKNCGLAQEVPCRHKWEVESDNTISNALSNNTIGKETTYKCTECTQRKYVRTELGKDPISKLI